MLCLVGVLVRCAVLASTVLVQYIVTPERPYSTVLFAFRPPKTLEQHNTQQILEKRW